MADFLQAIEARTGSLEHIYATRTVQYVFVGAAALAVLKKLLSVWTSPLRKLPGPWYAPWTDLGITYTSIKGRKHLWAQELHEKYGPIVRVSPNEVYVRSPTGAATIHQIKRPFLKGQFYQDFTPGVQSIFNTRDPEFHRRHRKLLSFPLSESQLQTVYLPRINEHFDLAFSKMHADIARDGVMDLNKWWLYLATDIIGELAFGDSFHMLEKDELNQYIIDLKGIPIVLALRFALGKVVASPWARYLPVFKQAKAQFERNLAFANESLDRHKRLVKEARETGGDVIPTLMQKMYKGVDRGMDEKGQTLEHNELRDDAAVFIIAGSDTTSNTLTYLVWAVLSHPEIHRKLVEEVGALEEGFTQNDLKELKFMNMVLQETLRLYSAAPNALPRVVPKGGAEIDGVWLPENTTVTTMAYTLHRDESVFRDAEEFDPYRWENPTKAMKDAWMPWGGGTRTCIGIHLAYIELRLGVARFFREFPNARISNRNGFNDDEMEQVVFFIARPKGRRLLIEA